MQSKNLEFVIAQATDKRQKSDFGKAVAASVEVGVVVPSIFRAKLADAGFSVIEDVAAQAEYGFATMNFLKRTLIEDKKGVIIAMGASSDYDDALLHAALGWFRENALPDSDVPEGIATVPAIG